MVKVTSRQRVDAFWANTLAVDAAEFHTPGIHVFPNPPQRATWRGLYVLAFGSAACVFTPPDLLDAVTVRVSDMPIEAVLQPETWQAMAAVNVVSALGPVVHYYRDDPDGLAELAAGRRINPDDADAVDELRSAVPAQEWSSAGFTTQTAVLFGIFADDVIVAAANLTPGPDAATDIGIVVRPDAGGKGYGVQVAATAARQALVMHGIARFRVLATSHPTLAIAAKLGFEEYGRNLTAQLS